MDSPVLSATALPALPAPPPGLDDPRREIRFGIIVAAIFFVGFLGWAAFARLDAAAYAHGSLVVSGQRQAVQHRDGGVVSEIFAREGQRVQRGQLLIRLAAAEVRAQERALTSQAMRLLAQRARLEAAQQGSSRVTTPEEFAMFAEADRPAADAALRLQQAELDARASVLAAQRGALGQRSAQSSEQGQGYSRQVASSAEQIRLIDQELAALRPLAERGFVSQTRVRALERARAELEGQRGQYAASVAQTREASGESRLQVLEAERSYIERNAAELREVETSLGDVLPRLNAARDQLARTEIRAPATGAVVGLSVFTRGGVIAPGQKLMDIVPERVPLTIQARVSPDDADDLSLGQATQVRFSSLHERNLPTLEGRLTRLSADSLTDERTGQVYFSAEVLVPLEQLNIIQEVRGRDFELRAGMPVEVLIPLRRRTALQYAMEPLVGAFWSSFREH